jgi:PIN domain nuclease of toxin-antitoxin system
MRALLDTHAFLWFIAGDPRLSLEARTLIEDPDNEKLCSMASIWEMAIKSSLGKLTLAQPFQELIPKQLESNGIDVLDIRLSHVTHVSTLPLYHRDPFDRIIIAQSIMENLPVVGIDSLFDRYQVRRIW